MSVCQHCQEGHVANAVQHTIYVTHDMALDAGVPELEGTVWHEGAEWVWEVCWCCGGDWQNCPVCRDD